MENIDLYSSVMIETNWVKTEKVQVPEPVVVEVHPHQHSEPHQTLDPYEQCKAECRRKRDDTQMHEYVEQLRQELAAAEAELKAEEERQKQANAVQNQQVDLHQNKLKNDAEQLLDHAEKAHQASKNVVHDVNGAN
ncbi:hypothetical protein WR25_17808 [Diploscapter pachys]|uniref:Uncharacterized protein n=1 Tax=Diploscapter pachys TaxID=2018661 RepID=A0A2A2KN86_9BILA|nr:hypothetical protein WR25_17808 [Diploscapter pachys]